MSLVKRNPQATKGVQRLLSFPSRQRDNVRSLLLALAIALGPAPSQGAPATATLPGRTLSVPIAGLTLPVPVTGDVRYRVRDDQAIFEGRAAADLARLQDRAPAVLSALFDQKQVCGEQLSVRKGQFGARGAALLVNATVDYGRNACIAGREVNILPRALYDLEMLLHPLVGARSLKFQAEVVALRKQSGELPAVLLEPVRQFLGTLVSQRIGELFPAGSVPPDVTLKSLDFNQKSGRLMAQVEVEGSVPRSTFERLLEKQ